MHRTYCSTHYQHASKGLEALRLTNCSTGGKQISDYRCPETITYPTWHILTYCQLDDNFSFTRSSGRPPFLPFFIRLVFIIFRSFMFCWGGRFYCLPLEITSSLRLFQSEFPCRHNSQNRDLFSICVEISAFNLNKISMCLHLSTVSEKYVLYYNLIYDDESVIGNLQLTIDPCQHSFFIWIFPLFIVMKNNIVLINKSFYWNCWQI